MDHKIVHWELMGPDGNGLKDFYSEAFGWKTEEVPGFGGYHMVDAASSGLAGAVGTGPEEMPNYSMIYIEVDRVDEHLTKVEGLGAKTIMPRTEIPGVVTFGMFADPAGNTVGMVERETPAAPE